MTRPDRSAPWLRIAGLLLTILMHGGLIWFAWCFRLSSMEPAFIPVEATPLFLAVPRETMRHPPEPKALSRPSPPLRATIVQDRQVTGLALGPAVPLPQPSPTGMPAMDRSPNVGQGEQGGSAPPLSASGDRPDPVIGQPAPEMDAGPPAPPPDYLGRILAKLERAKRYPAGAKAMRAEGTVVVRFAIDRRGRLLACRIEVSSGFPDLDAEVASLVRRSAPFPPLPDRLNRDSLELTVPIDFSLARPPA